MAAGIGSMNWWYERYSDTAGILTTQPSDTNSSAWIDPGFGWSKWRYYNFNADYVRHDENNNVGIVSGYVRHDENNQPIGVSPYVRHDIANVAFSTAGPNIPNTGP